MINENSLNIKVNLLFEKVEELSDEIEEIQGWIKALNQDLDRVEGHIDQKLDKKADYDEMQNSFDHLIKQLNDNH